jgi:hypothetical protein
MISWWVLISICNQVREFRQHRKRPGLHGHALLHHRDRALVEVPEKIASYVADQPCYQPWRSRLRTLPRIFADQRSSQHHEGMNHFSAPQRQQHSGERTLLRIALPFPTIAADLRSSAWIGL